MMLQVLFLMIVVVVIITLARILRSGRIREKYAALWIVVGLAIVVLGVWPGMLEAAAGFLGFRVPSNLLFFLAVMLLTGVALHLSLEVSKLEDESRILAEEVAMIHAILERHGLQPRLDGGTTALAPGLPDDEPES